MLFYAHSGLRYLVLLAALLAVAWFLFGHLTKRPVDRSLRIVGASFVGFLDLQILLGVLVLVTRGFYPQLIGHIVMMALAATVAHVGMVVNRKRAQPTWWLPLVSVLVALLLVVGGIMAIGRPLFGTTRI